MFHGEISHLNLHSVKVPLNCVEIWAAFLQSVLKGLLMVESQEEDTLFGDERYDKTPKTFYRKADYVLSTTVSSVISWLYAAGDE